MPLMMSLELASAMPAGLRLDSFNAFCRSACTRPAFRQHERFSAVSKEVSLIGCGSVLSHANEHRLDIDLEHNQTTETDMRKPPIRQKRSRPALRAIRAGLLSDTRSPMSGRQALGVMLSGLRNTGTVANLAP